jgi:hypothetical protein
MPVAVEKLRSYRKTYTAADIQTVAVNSNPILQGVVSGPLWTAATLDPTVTPLDYQATVSSNRQGVCKK